MLMQGSHEENPRLLQPALKSGDEDIENFGIL
jgi:hypothetical protein